MATTIIFLIADSTLHTKGHLNLKQSAPLVSKTEDLASHLQGHPAKLASAMCALESGGVKHPITIQ